MKRKVALLQVLAPQAPLLIMDEPTNALDPTMRDELLRQVRACRERGQAILFSSHVLSEVEQVADRVAILQRGKLVHLQAVAEMRESRLLTARLAGEIGPLPAGLELRSRDGDRVVFAHAGPLPPLLEWLAHQPLVELRLEPSGLSAVYQRYHGSEP
jgi:ABC-2 type transport system ATP-binding protein